MLQVSFLDRISEDLMIDFSNLPALPQLGFCYRSDLSPVDPPGFHNRSLLYLRDFHLIILFF